MAKLGSQKLLRLGLQLPCEQRPFDLPRYLSRKIDGPELAGQSIIVHRIDYNGLGALRGQRGLCSAKIYTSTLPGEKAKFMNLKMNDRAD